MNMFTGLIEKVVKIEEFTKNSNGAEIKIENIFPKEIKIGDSIAINGACLTVNKVSDSFLTFNVSNETLNISNISHLTASDFVNIERAMPNSGRFDGHLVYGHIDGLAKVKNIKNDGFSYIFEFETSEDISKYIVKKGSIAINGISLTVAKCDKNGFSVEVIPHTFRNTNLSEVKKGDTLNIETDIIARYIEKFLFLDKNDNKISMQMLKENGFF